MMGMTLNKKSYEQLISEDLAFLEKSGLKGIELEHIKIVLNWSVKQLYPEEKIPLSRETHLPTSDGFIKKFKSDWNPKEDHFLQDHFYKKYVLGEIPCPITKKPCSCKEYQSCNVLIND